MANGKEHHYSVEVHWTGNIGEGTKSHQSYACTHEIISGRKPMIAGRVEKEFRPVSNQP